MGYAPAQFGFLVALAMVPTALLSPERGERWAPTAGVGAATYSVMSRSGW